jgi:hypothetical protein
MDKPTKPAADQVHKYREDGEEAIKRIGKVVPIDAGLGKESPEGQANVPHAERPGKK